MTSLENSEGAGKSAKRESSSEKKLDLSAAALPASLAASVPPQAIPPLQHVPAAGPRRASGFLGETFAASGHSAGIATLAPQASVAGRGVAANGIATAGDVDSNSGSGFLSASLQGAASEHGHALDGSALQAGLQAPAHTASDAGSASAIGDDATPDTAVSASSESATAAAHALSASDKRAIEATPQRAAPGTAESASPIPSHGATIQPVAAGGESAFARDASAAHATPVTSTTDATAGRGAASGAHETFVALDAEAAHGPAWLHAGAHSAEAGFEDPALGWVSVRADLGAGGVHAAVVPGTAEAAQTLSTHMAGLSNYLSEQRTPVHTVTLAAPGNDAGPQQFTGQGGGQQSGTHQGATQQGTAPAAATPGTTLSSAAQPGRAAADPMPITARAGTSISLIA